MDDFTIRPVEPADYHAVSTMTRDAFWDKYQPGCDEHYLVHMIHQNNVAAPGLDLVAVADGCIIGNVICAPATITQGEKVWQDVLCLGPLTVAPAWQKKGVGSALMHHAIDRARSNGWRAIILTGNPAYYHRFGYRSAGDYGITFADGSAPDVLMCLPLYEHALKDVCGVYEDPPQYADLPPKDVSAFDKQFEPRERHILPTQIFEWKEW